MEKPVTKTGILLIIVASLAGLSLAILAANNAFNAHKTKRWPVTEGRITLSEVQKSSRYVPRIVFSYKVGSVQYSSEKAGLTNYAQYKKKEEAQKEADKYPVNAKVKVYYNPDNAEEAILKPGIRGEHIFMFLVGLIIFLAPVTGLIYSSRKRS